MSTTPSVTTGFEFKLADGSVVKAENIEEAFKTVAKMKEDTSSALKEERTKREEMEARLNAMQADIARNRPPERRDDNSFDRDRYFRLVGEDPIMAQNYLDAARFGIADPAQVPSYFQGISSTVSNLEQQTLAASFVNVHPDFPQGDLDAAKTLTAEVVKLRQNGHPVNMDTMNIAWQNCLSQELIKPIETAQEQEQPNPSLGGGGQGMLDAEAARIESDVASGKMSMTDFEAFLRSKGMLGA